MFRSAIDFDTSVMKVDTPERLCFISFLLAIFFGRPTMYRQEISKLRYAKKHRTQIARNISSIPYRFLLFKVAREIFFPTLLLNYS